MVQSQIGMIKRNVWIILIILIFLGIFFTIKYKLFSNTGDKPKIILYQSANCSQCKNVEDFLNSNKDIEDDVTIVRKDTGKSKLSQLDMQIKAKICKFTFKNNSKPPFLYDNGTCIAGDQQIIDYLTEKSL